MILYQYIKLKKKYIHHRRKSSLFYDIGGDEQTDQPKRFQNIRTGFQKYHKISLACVKYQLQGKSNLYVLKLFRSHIFRGSLGVRSKTFLARLQI